MIERKKAVLPLLPDDLRIYESYDDSVMEISYPYQVVANLKSVSLDKFDCIEGMLAGIKGQYLIFDNGAALNVRSHSGYKVRLFVY